MDDKLVIAGKSFSSRLITGTGKHRTPEDIVAATHASGTEIVTVAIRRLNLSNPNEKTILDYLDWDSYQILPNTAGSKTADEAVFTARLARENTQSSWVKVEVIPDSKYLLPDPLGTYEACKRLIEDGFTVLPYIHADAVLAERLQEIGCATVMPLGSPIGSGQGIHTREEIELIVERAEVPVVVDAGLAVPSDASIVMELGADAVLVNTAIAQARDPSGMAKAFKMGVQAGRMAFLSGRMKAREHAVASSPLQGLTSENT